MIRLGGLVPLLAKLGAARPRTWEVFQVPLALCVRVPKLTPFDGNGVLLPGGVASRSACRSAVIWRASISTKPDPFMPIVFRSLVALLRVATLPDSSVEPRVGMVSL